MKNRLLLYFTSGVLLLALAIMVDRGNKDTQLLQAYSDAVALYSSNQMAEGQAWVDGHQDLLQQIARGSAENSSVNRIAPELAAKPYTVLLYRKDTLLFCSNERQTPSDGMLARLDRGRESALLRFPSGHFAFRRTTLGSASAAVLLPVRYSGEGPGRFPADAHIPDRVQISSTTTPFPLHITGSEDAWLTASGSLQAPWLQALKLGAYGLLLLLLLVGVNAGALWLSQRFHPLAGFSAVLLVCAALIWGNLQWEWLPNLFGRLPLFGARFTYPVLLGHTLGDFLLNTLLFVWTAVFFHRSFKWTPPAGGGLRIGLAVLFYFLLMCGALASVGVFRQLVYASGIDFDFGNVLNLNGFSFAALGSIILFMAGVFLYGHRMMLAIRSMELPAVQRVGAQAVALVLSTLMVWLGWPDSGIGLLYLMGFALLYTTLYDYFITWESPGFEWVVLWLLLFSAFAAFLLSRYNQQLDQQRREQYAWALATDRDTALAEPLLVDMLQKVQADTLLPYLLKPWPFKPEINTLRQYFNAQMFNTDYLFEHYRLEVYGFDQERQPLLLGQTAVYAEIAERQWAAGAEIAPGSAIHYGSTDDGVFQYLARLELNRMGDASQPATLFCVFRQEFAEGAHAYAQLIFTHPYKNLKELSRYDFAVIRKGKLVIEQGQNSLAAAAAPVGKGEARLVRNAAPPREDVVARSADGQTLAVVGRTAPAWYRQIYLFAILFTLSSVALFLLAVLNPFLGLLPSYFHFYLTTQGSLSRRIHYWNTSLIVLAFLVIGVMTYSHFNSSARRSNKANFDYRAETVLTNLRTRFGDTQAASDTLQKTLPEVLGPLAASLGLDLNFFAPDGDIVYSNRDDLRALALIPSKLNPQVLETLRSTTQASIEQEEELRGKPVYNKYLPLRNAQNDLLGYISIPFSNKEPQAGPEVSDFMGMLASLYVFLLLIAGTATLALARSITKPLQLISDKIKELRFEDRNQPLDYQGDRNDELGALIDEYNRMVDKLEDSKVQLIRLEREGAWREMARQIAHDIKNPLTTMKLSMQQLERVSNDPMQAAAYLKKAITRLIEQIDSLAQIASEFSMFANLDVSQRQDLVLNDVVESVCDLFSEQKAVDLHLTLPQDRFHVSGDKSHLIRVFNNLVINAIQAIPPDRRGMIRVMVYRSEQQAVVQIRDNGGGIPPEIQKRVFEPNFTTKSSGSGLGLAICRRIVEALDGTIRFETREGEGTDFFVALPITSVGG